MKLIPHKLKAKSAQQKKSDLQNEMTTNQTKLDNIRMIYILIVSVCVCAVFSFSLKGFSLLLFVENAKNLLIWT